MLLTKEQYSELLSVKSITGAAEYLRALPAYKATFENTDMMRINRSRLEYLLEHNHIEVYIKFYRFTHGTERRFFGALLKEFEIYYLLEAVRACVSGTESNVLYRLPTYFNDHSDLNFHRIFSAHTPLELLDTLIGTEYYKPCAPILSGTQAFDFLLLESVLYNHYYKKLYYTEADKLDSEAAAAFRDAISLKSDLINMMRIIRMRRFSIASGTDAKDVSGILNYLIPLRLRLTSGDISHLVSAQTEEDALSVCDTIYPEFSKHFSPDTYDANLIEHYMKKHAKKLLRSPRASLMVAYGFLILKGIEADNITHAVEAIRYQLPPSVAEHQLVI